MRIFDSVEGFSDKVNFVDENNVGVGYDMSQQCCESADWFIHDEVSNKVLDTQDINQEDYYFDIDFINEHPIDDCDTGCVVFRLLSRTGNKDKYLHLYNCHNGYYGHGFTMSIGGNIIHTGAL